MSDVTDAADRLEGHASDGGFYPGWAADLRTVIWFVQMANRTYDTFDRHRSRAEAQSRGLAAVIDKALAVDVFPGCADDEARDMRQILATANAAEILRERDAAVWTKCVEHLEVTLGQEAKRSAHLDNPYRKEADVIKPPTDDEILDARFRAQMGDLEDQDDEDLAHTLTTTERQGQITDAQVEAALFAYEGQEPWIGFEWRSGATSQMRAALDAARKVTE